MRKLIYIVLFVALGASLFWVAPALAATPEATSSSFRVVSTPIATPEVGASASAVPVVVATPGPPREDITQKSEETLGKLDTLLKNQKLGGVWPANPVKYAIRGAVGAGVPANTIVLLLLLPFSAFVIAFSRNVVGIRGFGIFLPAALAVVFVATGPVVGIGMFLVIVLVSTAVRMILRILKIKLQYLPRMSFILWAVVAGVLSVLFTAPVIKFPDLANVSIFAILIMILLSEDFTRVQLGKSARTAISLTAETLILSLVAYLFLTLKPLQEYVLLNPEVSLISVAVFDLILGKYTGLRVMEYYRFRKLIKS